MQSGRDADQAILDIDGVSYAAAVGHLAAARLFGLMQDGDGLRNDWLRPGKDLTAEELDKAIEALAGECLLHDDAATGGEYAYRRAAELFGWHDFNGFDDLAFSGQMAWGLFSTTVLNVGKRIADLQTVIEQDRRREAMAASIAPLKLEDSIFEEADELDAQVDAAVEALAMNARAQERRPEKAGEPAKTGPMSAGKRAAKS